MTENDTCDAMTADDRPCQNDAGENGYCWIPSHNPGDDNDNPAGRPSKLTVGRQENIAQTIERGQSMKAAARANGIHPATMFNWLSQGEADKEAGNDDTPHAEFHDRIVRARGESERSYVDTLRTIAEENDDAAMLMTMLKQRHPDSWGEAKASEQKAGVNVYLDADRTTEIDPETLEVIDAEGGPVDDEADSGADATPEIESEGKADTGGVD